METFFTADHHFGHKRIIEMCRRPFVNVDDMEEQLIERWNAVVQPSDMVYHLGDFVWKKDLEYITYRLNGDIRLVRGNHDNFRYEHIPTAEQVFIPTKRFGTAIHLLHFPLATWNRRAHGGIHLHGHVHGAFDDGGGRLDCGVDNTDDYAPIHVEVAIERAKRPVELGSKYIDTTQI